MKVSPLEEEVMDLRRKLHVMHAENFIKIKNELFALIAELDEKKDGMSDEMKKKIEALRRKGAYYSVRGAYNFVRYTHNIAEINNGLRRILAEQKISN